MTGRQRASHTEPLGPAPWIGAVLLSAATTALALALRALVAVPDLEMLYLLPVLVAAVRFGRGPAVLTAALSVAAYDFFFVQPFHTFAVADVRYLLTFAMMFGVGLVAGTLTTRLRRQEREAAQRELERVRLAAEAEAASLKARTEELRSSLLSSVSHDLRTPLAAITGAATALLDDHAPVPEGQRRELIESICEDAERLERLVGNLLDMTRLESGALQPRREWVPVEELVGGALHRAETRLEGRPVAVAVADHLPLLHVDPVLLEQALINLLDNAARHTAAGGPIEVTARLDGAALLLAVSDRGPGLPAGAGERVFEKFYRGVASGGEGAGLGLPICRGIVEAHGGRLRAFDRPGGGATFEIALPRPSEQPR